MPLRFFKKGNSLEKANFWNPKTCMGALTTYVSGVHFG